MIQSNTHFRCNRFPSKAFSRFLGPFDFHCNDNWYLQRHLSERKLSIFQHLSHKHGYNGSFKFWSLTSCRWSQERYNQQSSVGSLTFFTSILMSGFSFLFVFSSIPDGDLQLLARLHMALGGRRPRQTTLVAFFLLFWESSDMFCNPQWTADNDC